jgi:small subunit ribosomal protein S1
LLQKKASKKIKSNLEKTTLGDISGLAALKEEMENAEKQIKEKAADSDEK